MTKPGEPVGSPGFRCPETSHFHSGYKRTLIVDRAMSLGWRRGLVDLYAFALYNNALSEYRQRQADQSPAAAHAITLGTSALRATAGQPATWPPSPGAGRRGLT